MRSRKNRLFVLLTVALSSLTMSSVHGEDHRDASLRSTVHNNDGIAWITKYNEARLKGTSVAKPVFLFITTDGCRHCVRMQQESFVNQSIVAELKQSFVPAKLHLSPESQLAEDLRVTIYPTTVIIAPNGKILDYARGYLSRAELKSRMREATNDLSVARNGSKSTTASR